MPAFLTKSGHFCNGVRVLTRIYLILCGLKPARRLSYLLHTHIIAVGGREFFEVHLQVRLDEFFLLRRAAFAEQA